MSKWSSILYKDEYQNKVEFPIYKEKRHCTNVQGPIVPNKILHHMPIIPRLQGPIVPNMILRHMPIIPKLQWMFNFKSLA